MSAQQLSFWDNEALETGYRHFANLDLEEAQLQFKKALEAGIGETGSVEKLLEACRYWLPRLKYSTETGEADSSSELIDSLLTAFVHYSFTPQMNLFKQALLRYIASLLQKEITMDLKSVETVFDLLLESGDLQNAEALILQCINQHPGKPLPAYLLAQVQWLSGNRSEANNAYATLLLLYPGSVEFHRIENKKLSEMIAAYGPAMAPAYAWLQHAVSLVSLSDEIEISNDEHRKAVECYRLLLGANKAMLNDDRNSAIQYRKKLKALSPKLFEEYFVWLQHQR